MSLTDDLLEMFLQLDFKLYVCQGKNCRFHILIQSGTFFGSCLYFIGVLVKLIERVKQTGQNKNVVDDRYFSICYTNPAVIVSQVVLILGTTIICG